MELNLVSCICKFVLVFSLSRYLLTYLSYSFSYNKKKLEILGNNLAFDYQYKIGFTYVLVNCFIYLTPYQWDEPIFFYILV